MEKKFIVPAVFFLGPLVLWILVFVLMLSGSALDWLNTAGLTALFAVLAALILYSGIACMKAGGPRMGNVVRSSFVLMLSGLTWWKLGVNHAVVMAVFAIALACLAVLGKYQEQEKQ